MAANSDVGITLTARTDEFEAKLKKAIGTFETLAIKGGDVSRAVDKSFKTISIVARDSVAQIERSFNALSIKSDFSLSVQVKALEQNAKFFQRQYQKIAGDGNSSAAEVTRAYHAMHDKLRQLAQTPIGVTKYDIDYKAALAENIKFNEQRIANDKLAAVATKQYFLAQAASYRETMSLEKGMADMRLNGIAAATKLRATEAAQEAKITAQRIADEAKVAAASAAAAKAAIMSRLQLSQETMSLEKGMADMRQRSVVAGEKLRGTTKDTATATKDLSVNVEKSAKSFNVMSLASITAIAGIQVMYSLINTVMSAIGSLPRIAMNAVESFNAAAISNAAMITSMQKGTRDLGERYKENKIYAEAVQEVLIKMDAQTAASGQNLTDMNRKFVQQGVLIDTNNKKQVEGYLNIANALATLTSGDANANMQYSQEVAALLRGEDRPSNKLFQMLNAMDNGKLKEHLELWRKVGIETGNTGLVLEKIGPMLIGFKAAQGDINALWTTTKSTLETIRDQVLRQGFAPAFEVIVGKMREMGEYATDNKDKIAAMMQDGFKELGSVVSSVTFVVKGISNLVTPLVKVIWYFKEIIGLLGLMKLAQIAFNTVAFKNPYIAAAAVVYMAGSWFVDYLKDVKLATEKTRELNDAMRITVGSAQAVTPVNWKAPAKSTRLNNVGAAGITSDFAMAVAREPGGAASMASSHGGTATVKVPTDIVMGGSDEDADGKVDAALSLASRLRDKMADLDKSYNETMLAENANARRLELQDLENSYDQRLISQRDYITKQQAVDVAAAEEEVATRRDTLASYQEAAAGAFASGDKGAVEHTRALIDVNKASKDLADSETELALLRKKNAGELAQFDEKELDYLKGYQLRYADMIGDFSGGEAIRQDMLANTVELWRLQQDVIGGVLGAEEALAAFRAENVQSVADARYRQQMDDMARVSDPAMRSMSTIGGSSLVNESYQMVVEQQQEKARIEAAYAWLETKKELNAAELKEQKKMFAELKANEQAYNDSRLATAFTVGESIVGIMRGMAGENKTMLMAALVVEKAIAVARIIMNTEVGATAALALGPIAGPPAAAMIRAMGYVSLGLVAASGAIEATNIQARAEGGPVVAGQTYLINENRKTEGPEYFTPGVNGVITPASKMDTELSSTGGQGKGVTVHQTINVRGRVDQRTATQIVNDAGRKQRLAQTRFG